MNSTENENEDNFSDDLVANPRYEAAEPMKKKSFEAWHRPRKHYVRVHQWTKQIKSMLQLCPRVDGLLRYFGLPGSDLLDLRHFHEHVCVPHKLSLRFLGFNKELNLQAKKADLNISLDEVRRLESVDPKSALLPDDFAQIGNVQSMAWKQAQLLGPFDVVNIDLCDGFAKDLNSQNYDAIDRLFALQSKQTTSWLLLLTTRTDEVDSRVFEKLKDVYKKNLIDCQPFRAVSTQKLDVSDDLSLECAFGVPEKKLVVFLCALSKWLAKFALVLNPPFKVTVQSVIGYRVVIGAPTHDLVSIAILLEPTFDTTPDSTGLSKLTRTDLDECKVAVRAINAIDKRKDADRELLDNHAMNETLITQSEVLLTQARYDIGDYRAWLAGQTQN